MGGAANADWLHRGAAGTFWMEFNDFVKYFDIVEMAKVREMSFKNGKMMKLPAARAPLMGRAARSVHDWRERSDRCNVREML